MDNSSHNTIRLTAGEVSSLWSQYQSDTMVICILNYFRSICEDPDIHAIVEYALQKSLEHVSAIQAILNADKFPVPIGFTGDDVNVNAPRLFTDVFVAKYLRQMALLGMTAGSIAIGMCARNDVSELFSKILTDAASLHNKVRLVKLEKGIYLRSPAISTPDKAEFISRQSFLGSMFGSEKRPLTGIEVTHLFMNITTNVIGKSMMMGFAQVATSSAVKEHMQRGKAIASKHIKLFSEMLFQQDKPVPMSWDADVTDSTVAPFSEKLMMFHTGALIAAGIANYAAAAAASQRSDIGLMYARLIPEIGLYGEAGLNILIDNRWLEEPPQADDRSVLVEKENHQAMIHSADDSQLKAFNSGKQDLH